MAYELSMQEENLRRGPWLEEEDERLKASVSLLGERRWDALAKESGLRRSGKSCRLRWLNYLRPNLKHGEINGEEELIIIQLHKQWGNKWAKIARRLPGRTDNEIKNYWRSHLRKKSAEAQQRAFVGEINHLKQDGPAPISDSVTPASSNSGGSPYEEKDDMSDTSDDYSYALYELSNSLFGTSPYEARVSDWMSYEQISTTEAKHYQTHSPGEECWGYPSCFCYPSWSYEEQVDTSVWDSPSSLWAMD